ncbi:MAG: DUF255 domain-containing protein [Mycobacterium sp.]
MLVTPVHWQQWSADALAGAARRDMPILLSIGYAACHWCRSRARVIRGRAGRGRGEEAPTSSASR